MGLIPRRFQAVDPIFKSGIIQIGDAAFDRVVETLKAQFRLGGPFVQFRDMFPSPVRPFLPPIEHGRQNVLQPIRVEQMLFEMSGDKLVERLHRDCHAFASGRTLPRLHRTGVVAIASTLSRADRHGAAAFPAVDQTRQQGRTTDDLGVRHPVVASAARELLNKSDNERSGVLSTAMSFLGL